MSKKKRNLPAKLGPRKAAVRLAGNAGAACLGGVAGGVGAAGVGAGVGMLVAGPPGAAVGWMIGVVSGSLSGAAAPGYAANELAKKLDEE